MKPARVPVVLVAFALAVLAGHEAPGRPVT